MDSIARKTGKTIFAGSLIVIAGVLLLLANFGFFDFNLGRLIFSWPNILIAFGVIIMFSSNFKSGFFLAGIGVVFLISNYYYIDLWTLWPAFLIIIGINSLLHARRSNEDYSSYSRVNSHNEWKADKRNWDSHQYWNANEDWKNHINNWDRHHHWKQEELDSDLINESAVFRGIRKLIHSSDFKGGKITTVFGGSEIDFSGCQLSPGNNVLDLETIFGGVTLFVPDDWKIIINISPVFGGISDERRRSSIQNITDDRVLIIRGTIVFGGVEIKSA